MVHLHLVESGYENFAHVDVLNSDLELRQIIKRCEDASCYRELIKKYIMLYVTKKYGW